MRKYLAAACLLFASSAAAQDYAPQPEAAPSPGGLTVHAAPNGVQWFNDMLGLSQPILNSDGSIAMLRGGTWSDLLTLSMSGAQTLTVSPVGTGPRTVKASMAMQDTVTDGTTSVWPHIIQTTSATGYGVTDPIWGGEADRINLFAGMSCLAGSSACWAVNPQVYLGAGFQDSAHGVEIDVENYSSDRDPGVAGYKPVNGLEITGGSSAMSSYAVDVVGNTSTIPYLFHDAYAVLAGAAQDNSFIDNGDATESLHILGTHGIGLDTAYATISNSAILLNSSQKLDFLNTSNGTTVHGLSSDGTNVILGANAPAVLLGYGAGHGYGFAGVVGNSATQVSIYAGGASANVGLVLQPQGTGTVSATAPFRAPIVGTNGYTVGALPAGTAGQRAYVTDATTCTFLGSLTGGGSTFCPVINNGAAWIAG